MPRQVLKGTAMKVGDNISTDHIIPGRFAHLRSNLPELAEHVLEDAMPGFAPWARELSLRSEGKPVLVAGKNLGLGSSREHAPLVIKMSGVGAILAESVARIFFRNAINQGLPVLLCDTGKIADGDELEINLADGTVVDSTSGVTVECSRIPPVMSAILDEGGLIPYIQRHGDFKL